MATCEGQKLKKEIVPCTLLLQNLMEFSSVAYKWDIAILMGNISKSITQCNLHSDNQLSQARSQIVETFSKLPPTKYKTLKYYHIHIQYSLQFYTKRTQ